ncbi:MAG: hypothetical protein Q7R62_02350, partial [bacterium]|nr:hypothetical protein [bacterium]
AATPEADTSVQAEEPSMVDSDGGDERSQESGESEEGISPNLKKARQRRQERVKQGAKDGSAIPEQPLTAENAFDNPKFTNFMLARFPDGETAELTDESLAAQVEVFNKHQEAVRTVADFYADLMEADGIVKVDTATREDFRSSIDAFLLKNLARPNFAEDLLKNIRTYKEYPARIAEKEKALAELGSRETLQSRLDVLVAGKERKQKLEADYGKGPVRAFLKGLFTKGWKSGVEAKVKSQEAAGEKSSIAFKQIDEALKSGVLDDLETKIKTLDDAERAKQMMTVAFDRVRGLIFDGIGELSGIVDKMKQKTRDTLKTMSSGEGDLSSLQDSFDRLTKARERSVAGGESYLDEMSLDQTVTDVQDIIDFEFEKQIEETLSKDLSKEKPYSALRKMLGQFSRLEKLGSKHSGEVRDFFKSTVMDYLKKNPDVPPTKRLILNRLLASFEKSEEAGGATEIVGKTRESSRAPEVSAEEAEKKSKIPKKGDRIKVTFPVKIQGMPQEVTDENAEIIRFKYKGEAPRSNAKMTVLVSYLEKPYDKKKKTAEVEMTYAHYLKFNVANKKA